MNKSDQLQELVLSLSKNEKGYFKKYCRMYSSQQDQKYLKLFELVDNDKGYSDKVILKKLNGEVDNKRLAVLKNYLYKLILKVLEHFYSNKYPDLEISNLINQAKVLYYKGLIPHALKVLKKARQQAEQHEFLYLNGEIIQFEQKLLNTSAKSKTKYQENKASFDTEMQNLDRIKNVIKCRDLERKIVDQHWLQGLNVGGKANFGQVLSELNVTEETPSSSVTAKLHYNNAYLLHQYINGGDIEKAFSHAEDNYNLIRDYPKVSKQDERKYIRILYGYLAFCLQLKKKEAFMEGVATFNAFKSKDIQTQADVFDLKYNLLFNYVLIFAEFEEGTTYIKNIEKELPTYLSYLSVRSQIVLYHLVAYIHHLNGNYAPALQAVNEIFSLKDDATRIDIQAVARIQDVLLHFDLENWKVVISKVRNCIRFLRKNNHYYSLNALLLKTLNLAAQKSNTSHQVMFKKLASSLKELTIEDPAEQKFLKHFDFVSWVNSKMGAIAFRETYAVRHA